ncbi:DUF742 domain-containing protein [Streptomyces noursei]|uniref:DUF742 domain-containing protein n=1 Tax=Streptomyces noursei TaxID=1971 RepID=UPI003B9698ED
MGSLVWIRKVGGRSRSLPPSGSVEQQVTRACGNRPRSVAEISGTLSLPVVITKLVLSNLIDDGVLESVSGTAGSGVTPEVRLLEDVLVRLRHKFADVPSKL